MVEMCACIYPEKNKCNFTVPDCIAIYSRIYRKKEKYVIICIIVRLLSWNLKIKLEPKRRDINVERK